jgi:hypothetical protein
MSIYILLKTVIFTFYNEENLLVTGKLAFVSQQFLCAALIVP